MNSHICVHAVNGRRSGLFRVAAVRCSAARDHRLTWKRSAGLTANKHASVNVESLTSGRPVQPQAWYCNPCDGQRTVVLSLHGGHLPVQLQSLRSKGWRRICWGLHELDGSLFFFPCIASVSSSVA